MLHYVNLLVVNLVCRLVLGAAKQYADESRVYGPSNQNNKPIQIKTLCRAEGNGRVGFVSTSDPVIWSFVKKITAALKCPCFQPPSVIYQQIQYKPTQEVA